MEIERDQRSKDKRIYLHQFLDVMDQHTNEQLGYLSDFSAGGMMFIATQPIAPRQVKDIYIVDNIDDERILIKAQIETVWTRPNLNPAMNCNGCRFVSIDDKNRALLEAVGKKIAYDSDVEINREMA